MKASAYSVQHQPLMSLKARALLSLICATSFIFASCPASSAQESPRRPTVAVLDFGVGETGRRAADRVAQALSTDERIRILDRDETRAASSGMGYTGSLNMTLAEARDLGASTGADFFITGDAQTLRRSPSTGAPYYDSYASVFLVSSRTGRLIHWLRPNQRASTPDEALQLLLKDLAGPDIRRLPILVRRAEEDEAVMRRMAVGQPAPLIEEAPDDDSPAAKGLKLPLPYRRLRPAYPESARQAEAEATVDVEVEITAEGQVSRVEVVRWAGFGLDEATIETVRKMNFRPAMRDGQPIPMRVLLRYNFRKPPVEGARGERQL